MDQLFLIAVFEVGFGISDRENLEIHSNQIACCILVSHITSAILNSEFRDQMHNQRSQKPASTIFHLTREPREVSASDFDKTEIC